MCSVERSSLLLVLILKLECIIDFLFVVLNWIMVVEVFMVDVFLVIGIGYIEIFEVVCKFRECD